MSKWTPEQARLFSVKGIETRRINRENRKNAPVLPDLLPPDQRHGLTDDGITYQTRRVMRVRKQLDRIDSMMLTEDDPQRLDRLASAQARLAEQERILDGRPLPGSRRPGKEATAKPTMSGPLD